MAREKKPAPHPLVILQKAVAKIDKASGSPTFTAREHARISIALQALQRERLEALLTLKMIGERYILPGTPFMGPTLHDLIARMGGALSVEEMRASRSKAEGK